MVSARIPCSAFPRKSCSPGRRRACWPFLPECRGRATSGPSLVLLGIPGPLNGHAAACALFIFLFFSLAALPQALRYRSLASRIPERITLTNASIRIDERSFSARELKSVVMTPASQTVSGGGISFRRQLFLQTALEQTKYLLGSTPDAPKGLLYEEYGSLLETIRAGVRNRASPSGKI